MAAPEYELGYLQAALPVMENFLLAHEVYWSLAANPPAGYSPYPNLSLGTLLLTLRKLSALQLSIDRQLELDRVANEIEVIQTRWRSAWEKKAAREFGARLTLWRNFMEEYRHEPENNADRYAYEVNRRAMLDLLNATAQPASAEQEILRGLDRLLQTVFVPGKFIWEEELTRGFPADLFWYLYGHLRGERE